MKIRAPFLVFIYIVAANVPFWIASRSMGLLVTGLFNVEVVIIGILSVFLRRTLVIGLLLVAILLDILRGINATYMLSPSEMFLSARYIFESKSVHLSYIVVISICIALICLALSLISRGPMSVKERAFVASTLAVFALFCGVADVRAGQTKILQGDSQFRSYRLTRFPVHSLVMSEWTQRGIKRSIAAGTDALVPSAATRLARLDTGSAPLGTSATLPNVVLVLVESWGQSRAADLEAAIVRPYADEGLSERYTISQGTVPFHGATLNGESRELCGSAMGIGLLGASASQLKRCLPAKMNGMGYHSMAVHGYSGRMFDRVEWYSRIGFDESWFREGLQGSGLPICPGPFPGICDAAASGWIGDRLQKSSDSPQFIYWVTLNSHLPVPISNMVASPPACEGNPATAQSPALCSWYQLEFNVHRSVAELAMRETARPTIFLLVGDHAPPFSSGKLRDQFSDKVVPYVLLVPKRSETKGVPQGLRSFIGETHSPVAMRTPHSKKSRSLATASGGQ
jgi:phosphoglycerol transferase MdoB-like AlkP superfamily enzyme